MSLSFPTSEIAHPTNQARIEEDTNGYKDQFGFNMASVCINFSVHIQHHSDRAALQSLITDGHQAGFYPSHIKTGRVNMQDKAAVALAFKKRIDEVKRREWCKLDVPPNQRNAKIEFDGIVLNSWVYTIRKRYLGQQKTSPLTTAERKMVKDLNWKWIVE